MDYDATSAGIEPGGLRNRSEIKLLICYILKTVGRPLSSDNLAKIIAEDGLANYFEVTASINELLENSNIIVDEQSEFHLTKSGNEISDTLEISLPFSVREKAVKSAMNIASKARREKENKVIIEKSDNGYHVIMMIMDNALEMMTIKILVPDSLQAEMIKEEFLKSPTDVYKKTFSMLIGNENM